MDDTLSDRNPSPIVTATPTGAGQVRRFDSEQRCRLTVGDVISEIDGAAAESVGQAQFGEMMRGPDGATVHLNLVRDGASRRAALVLKELVP